MRARSTGINLIAALLVSAVFLLAAEAWAQNQSGYTERGDKAQQGALGTTSFVLDKLPDVDRLSRRGVIFTDWYSRQSCTSGRAAFATGRYPARLGLTQTDKTDPN